VGICRKGKTLSDVIENIILISNLSKASIVMSLAISEYTIDSIKRLDGFINLPNGTLFIVYVYSCMIIYYIVGCSMVFKNMQNILFDIRDAEMMLNASVISLSAIAYCIRLIPSIQ